MNNRNAALDFEVNLIALIPSMLEYGHDPRNIFKIVLRSMQKEDENIDSEFYEFVLISMSEIIHTISPFYLEDVFEVIKVN